MSRTVAQYIESEKGDLPNLKSWWLTGYVLHSQPTAEHILGAEFTNIAVLIGVGIFLRLQWYWVLLIALAAIASQSASSMGLKKKKPEAFYLPLLFRASVYLSFRSPIQTVELIVYSVFLVYFYIDSHNTGEENWQPSWVIGLTPELVSITNWHRTTTWWHRFLVSALLSNWWLIALGRVISYYRIIKYYRSLRSGKLLRLHLELGEDTDPKTIDAPEAVTVKADTLERVQ